MPLLAYLVGKVLLLVMRERKYKRKKINTFIFKTYTQLFKCKQF